MLTVVSDGMGQDSATIRLKLAFDADFRKLYAPGDLVAVHADTGNEHEDTYQYIELAKQFYAEHGIEFHHLTADRGYHSESWKSLQHFYETHKAIGSKAFPKTCTSRLKLEPIYRWLNVYVQQRYFPQYPQLATERGKKALYLYRALYGQIVMLIGIAKGEEKRVSDKPAKDKWMRENILRMYPLIEIGYDREDCQRYIAKMGQPVPPPSNCVFCPFKNAVEILWTARRYPTQFTEWVRLEQQKIDANQHKVNNLGVNGKKLLPQVLQEAEAKHGHMSLEELSEYRMSHGHCVASAY